MSLCGCGGSGEGHTLTYLRGRCQVAVSSSSGVKCLSALTARPGSSKAVSSTSKNVIVGCLGLKLRQKKSRRLNYEKRSGSSLKKKVLG